MEFRKIIYALMSAATISLTACAPNVLYRHDYSPCVVADDNHCDSAAISLHYQNTDDAFELGFVEYDDQGQLRDRAQMQAVLDHYYPIAGTDDVLLTVFVHGWHHNAAPGDTNIESFKGLLRNMSRKESEAATQDGRKKRRILGVYIGWRGESITAPVLTDATFWARKAVAQEVGLQGVSEVLLRLEEIVNVKAGYEDVPRPLNSRMVIIGHSFGGAVVYTSLQQILADRYVDSRRGKTFQDTAKGFGDLVVLMNPAFEAMRYSTLFDISQSCVASANTCRAYTHDQLPRLAVLTSEADYATRYAFPAGRFFATLFETHDKLERYIATEDGPTKITVNEADADDITIGHFEPYWTHRLDPIENATKRSDDFNWRSLVGTWSQQQYDGTMAFEQVNLEHLGRSDPLNPYLNVYVSGKLIKDHNDIWGDEIQGFLHDLIVISTTPNRVESEPSQ